MTAARFGTDGAALVSIKMPGFIAIIPHNMN
ncbi:hypothetical protein Thi970DRAFT_01282 [Thiorhodovibrio frisius]|uniref:Uncharacterized protein n=1 Tax=Thiorhodovibrio frisius TaxID=631362 RepID=H8YYT3_9GAMM|nr:hypothetical protein Thi970DRAFT_01282 [Thiorhodovibrio frisius]WPL13122.1 hypothetical protein Thiosp_02914 [Thiorhodovibrio litoralis]WPL23304.1 hypothetical protein Thiofri_03489 [Thiorhodovibrio frisius]